MQIVIELADEIYEMKKPGIIEENINEIISAVIFGKPLPKGHGKLIDSNVLWDAFQDLGQDFYEAFDFAEANAVIEADEEVE